MCQQHTLLGTKPMARGSRFHLFHCPARSRIVIPNPPKCLRACSLAIPSHRGSCCPTAPATHVPALTPDQVQPGPERSNLAPQHEDHPAASCSHSLELLSALQLSSGDPSPFSSLVLCLGSAEQTPAGDCSYTNTGGRAQRPEHLFDTKPHQPSKG